MYLENINSPADVKKLSVGELTSLCAEMREALIQKLSVHGGHVARTSEWWRPQWLCIM